MVFPFSWWVLILKPLLIQKWEVGGLRDPVLCIYNFLELPYIFVFQSHSSYYGCIKNYPRTQQNHHLYAHGFWGLGIQTRAQQGWFISVL